MVTFSERVDNLKTYLDVIGDSFDGMTGFVVHDPLWRGIAPKRPETGRGYFRASQDLSWGDKLVLSGEFQYRKGYWEWTEDILIKCGKTLGSASIYNDVYASLYTYDRLPRVVRAFCQNWNPSTNTLITVVGELSISLWNFHKFGGFPILGDFFDEVIPSARELTRSTRNKQRLLHKTCDYLFHVFHLILQKKWY
ncbi:hypothetical protein LIER_14664 [Lithospermum erythrorhizon]|uniref:Uncharacterized protein n=1 Tax=Lithospermum erythrorhizon TaxID=34254 RepID=A0AAV3Q1I8_LITER